MKTFIQFLNESTHQPLIESADQEYHAWYKHPHLGVLHAPGASAHATIAKKHDFDDIDEHPRGWFMVNKKEKKTHIKPYEWTGKPNTQDITNHLRKKLKVPSSFSHVDHSTPTKPKRSPSSSMRYSYA